MSWLRWTTFKFLSWVGWKICPEPHRSNLQAVMPPWGEIDEHQLEGDLRHELRDISFGAGK